MAKFAIISDLHSNLEAVEAVFGRITELGVDDVVCLGDVVGYGADPLQVAALVMQRCKWTILGNHDWGLFHALDDFNPLAREALVYARRQLKPSWLRPGRRQVYEFLKGLPERKEDFGYRFYHGSPRDPVMEYVMKSDGFLEPEKMQQLFAHVDGPCFVGHTHWPGVHRPDFRFTQATDEQREFALDGPCIVNVGSVGQPRDGDPLPAQVPQRPLDQRACVGHEVGDHHEPARVRRRDRRVVCEHVVGGPADAAHRDPPRHLLGHSAAERAGREDVGRGRGDLVGLDRPRAEPPHRRIDPRRVEVVHRQPDAARGESSSSLMPTCTALPARQR